MFFKRKETFFLDLSQAGKQAPESKPAEASPAEARPAASKPAKAVESAAPVPVPAASAAPEPVAAAPVASEAPAPTAPAAAPVFTTAEAMAAELRAAQEARPAPSNVTFAPECLNPANAVPTPRRRAGANLALFKGMVDEMFRS